MRSALAFALLVFTIGITHDTYSQQADAGVQTAGAAPWPMFGHDARHTGRTPLVGLWLESTRLLVCVRETDIFVGSRPDDCKPRATTAHIPAIVR